MISATSILLSNRIGYKQGFSVLVNSSVMKDSRNQNLLSYKTFENVQYKNYK